MPLFLTLETVVIFIGHHVECRRWNNYGCELLYSIKLLNFGDDISECSQAMGILQSINEDPDGGSIIHKIASLSLCFALVDVCTKDSFSY